LDNDCVIVPGFGGFMAHNIPAKYDEENCIFIPPMRIVGFNPQLTMNVNATRSFDFLRFAAHHWMADGGRVVVLGSVVGSVAETDQITTPYYCMSKAALNMAVKMLSVEHKQLGWAVIHPGLVHTKMTKGMSFRNPTAISPEVCAVHIRERMVNDWPGFGFWHMADGRRIRW
jgi:NAD(P)-dependent dehydrogenase (short-subunit alcohol dehydrogenase family)